MERFASGWKRNYYGKGDIIVYRLHRDGQTPDGRSPVFGANVQLLIYGDAFWPTYTTGDNTDLIATDSMKNFIQRETMNYAGFDLESYGRFLCEKFLTRYPQAEGAQVSVTEIPYNRAGSGHAAFTPGGPERAFARIEILRDRTELPIVEIRSGLRGFRLLRLGGSAFHGFVRDEYTTLPDIRNRPLHMWLDVEWTYVEKEAAFQEGAVTSRVRNIVNSVFEAFESGSIQQVIYQIGARMLEELPSITEVDLEANNRTWDTVLEQGDSMGVYTDARPPYGILGLTLRR